MKAVNLKKGMLLTSMHEACLVVMPRNVFTEVASIVQAKLTKKLPQFICDEVKYMLYIGTCVDLGLKRSLLGQQYVLANGKIMIVDRGSWRYIAYVSNYDNLLNKI